MPVPSRSCGVQAAAIASGTKPSVACCLGRPDVAVAESGDLLVELLMSSEWGAVVGDGDTEAAHRSTLDGPPLPSRR